MPVFPVDVCNSNLLRCVTCARVINRLVTAAMDCITPAVARECGPEDAEELESSGLTRRLQRYSISTDYICRDNIEGNAEVFNFT